MKKFIISYLLLLPTVFGLFYWDISPIAVFINHYQSESLLYLLDSGLKDGQLQGIDIIISPYYKIIITKACNGMIPYLVLVASVLAYPARWTYRFKWLIIGYIVFSMVNVLRLFIVVHFVTITPDNFPLYHDILGNFLLMSSGLIMFYLFVNGSRD